jgi:hypothetical protein
MDTDSDADPDPAIFIIDLKMPTTLTTPTKIFFLHITFEGTFP